MNAACFRSASFWLLSASLAIAAETRWYKGNLHTHTLWSDGDDYPEMVADWYKSQGYNFLALSDHNVMLTGEKWVPLSKYKTRNGAIALERYEKRFGADWVVSREVKGEKEVRLRTLEEFRPKLEIPGRFLMIPGEEITDKRVHVNATNLREVIEPDKSVDSTTSEGVVKALRHAFGEVAAQRTRTGIPMFAHVNHPNFVWALTAEEMMQVEGEQFFEVYNGHPSVHNEGDELHAGVERVWDIVLAERLGRMQQPVLFGLATDDSHNYHTNSPKSAISGRGWVMVRAKSLEAGALIEAMEQGDFYASSGVTLKDVRRTPGRLALEVQPEAGVEYVIEFFGTRRDYDRRTVAVTDNAGKVLRVTRRYSADVGALLATVRGTKAEYVFRGDELYVRARVTSTKPKALSPLAGEVEQAWVQPTTGK